MRGWNGERKGVNTLPMRKIWVQVASMDHSGSQNDVDRGCQCLGRSLWEDLYVGDSSSKPVGLMARGILSFYDTYFRL